MREDVGVFEEMAKANSRVDWDALRRSLQAAEQLAEVGIELGGYHLSPALGDMQSVPPGTFDQNCGNRDPLSHANRGPPRPRTLDGFANRP